MTDLVSCPRCGTPAPPPDARAATPGAARTCRCPVCFYQWRIAGSDDSRDETPVRPLPTSTLPGNPLSTRPLDVLPGTLAGRTAEETPPRRKV